MPLFIVSTPIGNLKDITLRALETLKEADVILAEDTRRTGILLKHYSISYNRMISYNDHNKEKRIPEMIGELKNNKKIAIVSDSGTPGISDPGFSLIREAIRNDIPIVPIPGATASIAALVSSGFATDSFVFYGFIPKKGKENFFNGLSDKTAILYESPYRLIKTLKALADIMPEREICVARELTKKFEELTRGPASHVYEKLKDRAVKGEITIIISKK